MAFATTGEDCEDLEVFAKHETPYYFPTFAQNTFTLIDILFEDDDLVVVNKPAGMASQSTAQGGDSLPELANKNWLAVHRLDQRVSGLMLFAKNVKGLAFLNDAFAKRTIQKHYRAIVANKPSEEQSTLTHWLLKNSKLSKSKAYVEKVPNSKQASLAYKVVQSSLKYHLLEIELFTGRFHQIRAQLAAIGSPIVGDVKYGYKRTIADGSIFLQSYKLGFQHPVTKEPMLFELEMPVLWKQYGF